MFIRTKDVIYEVKKVEILCGVKFYDYETREDFTNRTREEFILKESDTIEELCDGFYIDKCKEEFLYDEIFDECWYDFNPYFKECAKNGIDVYGFIKTDKGLQYIAKLNSKGELELL